MNQQKNEAGKRLVKPMTHVHGNAIMILVGARMDLAPSHVADAIRCLKGGAIHPMTGAAIEQEAVALNDRLRVDAALIAKANAIAEDVKVQYGFAEREMPDIREVAAAMAKVDAYVPLVSSEPLWWNDADINRVLNAGVVAGYLCRLSVTQVQWIEAGIKALKAAREADRKLLQNGAIVTVQRPYAPIADKGDLGVVVDAPEAMRGHAGSPVLVTVRGYIVIEPTDVEPAGRKLEGATFEACNAARTNGTLQQALIDGKLRKTHRYQLGVQVLDHNENLLGRLTAVKADRDRFVGIVDGKMEVSLAGSSEVVDLMGTARSANPQLDPSWLKLGTNFPGSCVDPKLPQKTYFVRNGEGQVDLQTHDLEEARRVEKELLDQRRDSTNIVDEQGQVIDETFEEAAAPEEMPETISQAEKAVSNRKPFEIPAINNEKLALMRYLKLNGDDDADYAKVNEHEGFELDNTDVSSGYRHTVAVFEYNNERYHVVHAAAKIAADVLQEFNSSLWRIKKVESVN